MQNYTKLQKYISFLLIFSTLFSFTINVSFFSFLHTIFASDNKRYDIVAIVVEEDIFSSISSSIDTYAKNIQAVLPDTKTMIIPTPSDAKPFMIASLLEKLYFEGYNGINGLVGDSNLKGVVFVGNIPLPIVSKDGQFEKTILPYVDFEDKAYIFNHEKGYYEYNKDLTNDFKAEIFHSFISPNTGDKFQDISQINDYFAKNDDFYKGKGLFDSKKQVINGKKDIPANYKPYVFYFDQFVESKRVSYLNFKGYQNYLENKEDLEFNRFSSDLIDKLKSSQENTLSNELKDLSTLGKEFSNSDLSGGLDYKLSPDIHLRSLLPNYVKKFIEIFNGSTIGNFRKDVNNAGRYSAGSDSVNVHLIPYLISIIDTISDVSIKRVTLDLEDKIDSIVKNGLSRDIAIPTEIKEYTIPFYSFDQFLNYDRNSDYKNCINTYTNILYGKQAKDITSAIDCSIYRGSTYNSGQLVEANRGFDIYNVDPDVKKCKYRFSGYWGNNTPVLLDQESLKTPVWKLKQNNLKASITPLFDIKGTTKINDNTKNPSPLLCLENNFIVTETQGLNRSFNEYSTAECFTNYRVPINGQNPIEFSCTTNNKFYDYTKKFTELYKETNKLCSKTFQGTISFCKIENKCRGLKCLDNDGKLGISFKKIPSYIEHKSPTAEELREQIKHMIAKSLPIDRDRYIDFIGANGKYAKINYPYLYRLSFDTDGSFNLDKAKSEFKKYLDNKSKEINNIILSLSPSSLSGKDKEIYNLLKTGDYPNANVDLYKFLEEKEDIVLDILGEKKTITYLDSILFSLYWNNLNSVSAKYKFIFENYLSDQTKNNLSYFLPQNKKLYEIAYLNAPGDPQNMYVKLDPEDKGQNPYADIIMQNSSFFTSGVRSDSGQINKSHKSQANFKCAPPEGVPIWEWIPAIFCWIREMLPPTISISEGNCGSALFTNGELSSDNISNFDASAGISLLDYLVNESNDIEFKIDSKKYPYNKSGEIKLYHKNASGSILGYDNLSIVSFNVSKIELDEGKIIINPTNEEIKKYINFSPLQVRNSKGVATYNFTTKNTDAKITFKAKLQIKNHLGDILKEYEKEQVITISSDGNYINNYILSTYIDKLLLDSSNYVKADDKYNVYFIDENYLNAQKSNLGVLSNLSSSKEKLFLSFETRDKNGKLKELSYPIRINIFDEKGVKIVGNINILSSNKNKATPLGVFRKSGTYKVEIKDNNGYITSKEFEVYPNDLKEIKTHISTNLIEKDGVITTHAFSLYDNFQNIVSGKNYEVSIELSGDDVLTFEDGQRNQTFSIFDGYRPFRLITKNKTGTAEIKIKVGDLEKIETIKVVDKLDFDIYIPNQKNIKVGNNTYDFQIKLKNYFGGNFNSRAYLQANKVFISKNDTDIKIINGFGTGSFNTTTKSNEKLILEFKIEGVKNPIYKEISILPEVGIKMDLSLSKSKIEAANNSTSILYVEIKDRYNNLVWNDNKTTLNLEILDKYKSIIKSDNLQKTVLKGKANFILNATQSPGTAYFKVSSSPSLSNNSFTIDSKDGPITINGIGENAGKIETFYFWKKENIYSNYYNALYTTLIGANYGDITIKDNLANSIIFDKNNRALAVTSLLNNPTGHKDIFTINPRGGVVLNDVMGDLSLDISYQILNNDGNLEISFLNNTSGVHIGSLYYNFKNTNINICEKDLKDCYKKGKNNLILKSLNPNYKTFINEIKNFSLKDNNGETILEIDRNNGKIVSKSSYLNFDINNNSKEILELFLKVNGSIVGVLGINFDDKYSRLDIIRDSNFLNYYKTLQSKGGMIFYSKDKYYYVRDLYTSNNVDKKSISIAYNDPFGPRNGQQSVFEKTFEYGYNSSETRASLGWEGENKILLSFASGKSVGEATKDYQTFSLINIGDPIISLPPISKKLPSTPQDRKFDSTIGNLISKDENNLHFNIFDYNNDGINDVVILKKDGYIELLEGTGNFGNYINRKNIVYISDISKQKVLEVGDFTGDGYEDFILLNDKKEAVLINNTEKDFTRIDLKEELNLAGNINQIIAFDMDLDLKTDIVILDDAGDINIFYGTNIPGKFHKKKVASGLFVELSSNNRKDKGAIYFDGLYQLKIKTEDDLKKQSEDLLKKFNNQKNNEQYIENIDNFNENVLDRLIFIEADYTPFSLNIKSTSNNNLEGLYASFPADSVMGGGNQLKNQAQEISQIIKSNQPGIPFVGDLNLNKKVTFIRSEYAQNEGFEIIKKFTDINGKPLKGKDKVRLEIIITNKTGKNIKDIAYMENIPELFNISENPDYKLKVGNIEVNPNNIILKKRAFGDFDFLIDSYLDNSGQEKGFELKNNQSIVFSIILDTNDFTYGYIEAGLFNNENPEGDIIFKEKSENCGQNYDLYKSIGNRNYKKTTEVPTCENNLPESIAENAIDKDGNGVPDYIDALIDSGKSGNISNNFKEKGFGLFTNDSDGDGIPDREDMSPNKNIDNFSDYSSFLGNIEKGIEDFTAGLETVLAGFSCGFGGGGCIATPLNWAPLAPGGDPTLFGFPIGDGLKVSEGLPIFSAITWIPIYVPSCLPVPTVWPVSSSAIGSACYKLSLGLDGAGGRLGTLSPTNFVRIFITPTLTGAMGMAVCFGRPAILAGYSVPPGLYPFVTAGNCIVAAMPTFGCKGDGSDGEIYNMRPISSGKSVISGSSDCSGNKGSIPYIGDVSGDYINYKKNGNKSSKVINKIKNTLSKITNPRRKWELPDKPLISVSGGGEPNFEINFDTKNLKVEKIQMTTIMPFPDFITDWVKRQIEEIVMKLTDFPTLYIILPSFEGIFGGFDSWDDFMIKLKESYNKREVNKDTEKRNIQNKLDKITGTGGLDSLKKTSLEGKIAINSVNSNLSGIREVYDFLSNIPIVNIVPEKVNIDLPWIDDVSLDKAIENRNLTIKQRKEEVEKAKESWSFGYACDVGDTECQKQKEIASKIILDANALISSLEKNIQVLEDYKRFPEKLNKMIRIKELRLEQILCNIENITKLLGGWISDNGKRFKAWVELYVLVKAILKSWQLLVDIFIDYEQECHQCKNERWDLMHFILKLISFFIPSIPVIQFPKWPDIYLDLHNIRMLLEIPLPDFEFNLRPILLPTLPNLYLPEVPNLRITLPSLPILPTIELPELPDLPSLPSIELPNLPPPPKLPKLFSEIEGVLGVLKTLLKILCLLKSIQLVPEWRAGDLIASITERSGYLPIDFLDVSLPQFSLPFIDAIKVTTYVNLEFERDFLVEMAKQATAPLNKFTNNVVNMFDIGISDLDFRGVMPSEINIGVGIDGSVDSDLGAYNKGNIQKVSLYDLSKIFALNIKKLHNHIEQNANNQVTISEFKELIKEELKKPGLYESDNTQKIVGIFNKSLNYSFTKEDKFINKLLENNEKKYNTLKDIIKKELDSTRDILKKLNSKPKNTENACLASFHNIDYKTDITIGKLANSITDLKQENDISLNNILLKEFNDKTIKSLINLVENKNDDKEYKEIGNSILSFVNTGMDSFSKNIKNTKTSLESYKNNLSSYNSKQKLLASTTVKSTSQATDSTKQNTCETGRASGYSYNYKGLYVVEKYLGKNKSYRLFNYLDELTGKEKVIEIDADKDGDEDAFYMVGNQIFVKQNLLTKKRPTFYSGNPIILKKGNHQFYEKTFYEGVNGFSQVFVDNGYLNANFKSSTNKDLNNYSLEFYQIVDKFSDKNFGFLDSYIPKKIKSYIIDMFADIDNITKDGENEFYTINKNLAYLSYLSPNILGIEIEMTEFLNIKDSISSNQKVVLQAGKTVYTTKNDTTIQYYENDSQDIDKISLKTITIPRYSNISFKKSIKIVGLNGDLLRPLINKLKVSGNDIKKYLNYPILPETKIIYNSENEMDSSKRIIITYYDNSERLLEFDKTKYYELYDLGGQSDNYMVRTRIPNDYYYARILSFKNNIFSTFSNQILFSPQKEADKRPPEISNFSIRVPVYQSKIIDITKNIFEESGNINISNVYIDFDSSVDKDNDGNPYNDKDYILGKTSTGIQIVKDEIGNISLRIGPFDELITKNIYLYVVDSNNNVGKLVVPFVIYSPIPEITGNDGNLIHGKINENLINEPLNLYRLRGGNVTKINSGFILTQTGGSYDFIGNINSGIILKNNENILLNINEQTGKIDIPISYKSLLNIIVYPTYHILNDVLYPKIVVKNGNDDIYYEYFQFAGIPKVEKVNSLSEIETLYQNKTGIYYFQNDNSYIAFEMPLGLENNSGDLIIYDINDINKTPIAVIYRDGRVELRKEFLSLTYDTYNDFVMFDLKKDGNIIGKIVFIPEDNFILK